MNYALSRLFCWILLLGLWIGGIWCLWIMLQNWGVLGETAAAGSATGEAAKEGAEAAKESSEGEDTLWTKDRIMELAKVVGSILGGHVIITACLASYRIARRGGVPGGIEVVDLAEYGVEKDD